MTNEPSNTDPSNRAESLVPARPDREPTADESAAAERGAANVDLDAVTEREREMLERGANVQGEGQIEPE